MEMITAFVDHYSSQLQKHDKKASLSVRQLQSIAHKLYNIDTKKKQLLDFLLFFRKRCELSAWRTIRIVYRHFPVCLHSRRCGFHCHDRGSDNVNWLNLATVTSLTISRHGDIFIDPAVVEFAETLDS